MGDLSALLAERNRLRAESVAALDRNREAIMREVIRMVGPAWAIVGMDPMIERDRLPGRGYRYPVSLIVRSTGMWDAYAYYRPSDHMPAGAPDRMTESAEGATPREALRALSEHVAELVTRTRRPEVVADLRHLHQWLLDVVAEMDGVEVSDG